jgi:hypothetical protein
MNQVTGSRALLSGHNGLVIDIAFCPWHSSLLLSLASDGVAILWRIGDDAFKKGSEYGKRTCFAFLV